MAVITIARQFGAGGRTLGKRLSRQLNYEFFDDSIIQELSKKAKVSKFTIKDIEQTAGSFFSKIVSSALSRSYMERLTGADIGYMDENIYVEPKLSDFEFGSTILPLPLVKYRDC